MNIRRYYEYLLERVKAYQDTKTDFVRSGAGKMRALTVDKGLLRQTEIVQAQIKALLKCDVRDSTTWCRRWLTFRSSSEAPTPTTKSQ